MSGVAYLIHGPAIRALESDLFGDSTQRVGDSFAWIDSDRFRLSVEKVNPINDRL